MSEISTFKNVKEVNNPVNEDLQSYLYKIHGGEWEDIVNKCRLIKDKKERDSFKTTMPTTTFSGTFSSRKDSEMSSHSGFIAMDIDGVADVNDVKKILIKDKYVYSIFVSTSGNGLRVLFRIDSEKHRESFYGICQYLFNTYGIICDPNGVNPSKPYIVSFDPHIYINPNDNVPVFKKYIKETVIKKIPDFVYTRGDFDSILKQIIGRQANICESYNDWLKVAFAISEHFGEEGRSAFHSISQFSPKYKFEVAERQYTACLKARGTTKAHISTFYYLAKAAGINISSEQTRTIVRSTRNGKKAGLSKEQIIGNLLKFNNINNADTVVNNIFDSDDADGYEDKESMLEQLEMFISTNYNLRMNEVTGFLEQNGKQLSPSDLNTVFIAAKKLLSKLDYQLMIRLLKSDFIESYNPFFQFFGSDGIPVTLPAIPTDNIGFESPLIDRLAKCIVNDKPDYTVFFLRKWMIGVVSAAHKVHSPLLLCLLGSQNTGKTEFFRRLLPKELSGYYAESKLDKEKDDEILMTENLLVMDDELGGKSKADALKMNNITSKQWFSLRRPYGDHNEKILRLAVLCGTSNYKVILSDPTGNRRIIPIDVTDIDKLLYNSIDKNELWMEAYRLYKEGFDWRISGEDIKFLNTDQVDYEVVIKERELIEKYFAPGYDSYVTSTEVLVEIEIMTRQKLNIQVIGREMEKLGFIKKTIRVPINELKSGMSSTPKKWCVVRINRVSEIYTNGNLTKGPDEDLPF